MRAASRLMVFDIAGIPFSTNWLGRLGYSAEANACVDNGLEAVPARTGTRTSIGADQAHKRRAQCVAARS